MLVEEINIKTAWKNSADALRRVGVKTPLLDARLLLQHVLGITYEELLLIASSLLTNEQIDAFNLLIERRIKREPVSKILGVREFYGRQFKVTKDTLDPRPDSETMINVIKARYADASAELDILDLGTGTGCLLITLLAEYTKAKGVGVDISEVALAVAKENAKKIVDAEESRASFINSNWLEKVEGSFDIIITNPPYIKTEAIDYLAAEVRNYDPIIALDGGGDGLRDYHVILQKAHKHLKPFGRIYLEIGQWQDKALEEMAADYGYKLENIFDDFNPIPRIVELSKPHLKVVR